MMCEHCRFDMVIFVNVLIKMFSIVTIAIKLNGHLIVKGQGESIVKNNYLESNITLDRNEFKKKYI